MGKQTPRGILVVHDDTSEKVARLVMASLRGKGFPLSHRNIRYDYHPDLYMVVLAIGVEDGIKVTKNTFCFDYTPYARYQQVVKRAKMNLRTYQNKAAEKIVSDFSETLDLF